MLGLTKRRKGFGACGEAVEKETDLLEEHNSALGFSSHMPSLIDKELGYNIVLKEQSLGVFLGHGIPETSILQ